MIACETCKLVLRRRSLWAQNNACAVRRSVIGQLDIHATGGQSYAIEFDKRNPTHYSIWVLDDNFVAR